MPETCPQWPTITHVESDTWSYAQYFDRTGNIKEVLPHQSSLVPRGGLKPADPWRVTAIGPRLSQVSRHRSDDTDAMFLQHQSRCQHPRDLVTTLIVPISPKKTFALGLMGHIIFLSRKVAIDAPWAGLGLSVSDKDMIRLHQFQAVGLSVIRTARGVVEDSVCLGDQYSWPFGTQSHVGRGKSVFPCCESHACRTI